MKVLDSIWFINCGIVMVDDPYEGIKYYIRGLQAGEWSNPEKDAQMVAEWGSTFSKQAVDVLFGRDVLRNGEAMQLPQNTAQAELMVKAGMIYLDSVKHAEMKKTGVSTVEGNDV